MKLVALTQRIDVINGERRNSVDSRWFELFNKLKITPHLIPNDIAVVRNTVKNVDFQGVILSGGNTLSDYGGDAADRDEVEFFLLEYAMEQGIPLLGVCRGMQVIQHHFGMKLERIAGHAGCRHQLQGDDFAFDVNSFHDFSATEEVPELNVLARAEDSVIEYVKHKSHRVSGIMWHPEREEVFRDSDLEIMRNALSL